MCPIVKNYDARESFAAPVIDGYLRAIELWRGKLSS